MKNQTQRVKDVPNFAHIASLLLKIYVPSKCLAVKELPAANGSQKIKQMFKNAYQIKHLKTLEHTQFFYVPTLTN
jgi:hypothetical protein